MARREYHFPRKQRLEQAEHPDVEREGVLFAPPVDIYETEDGVVIVADLPGVSKDRLRLELRDDRELVLDGEISLAEGAGERLLYKEYDLGHRHRHFSVSEEMDRENISAELKEGVLTVSFPKREQLKRRKVEVKVR